MEYQACKKESEILARYEGERLKMVPSPGISIPCKEEMIEADLFDLLNAYYIIFKEQINPSPPHNVSIDPVAIEDEMLQILKVLTVKKKTFFRLIYKNSEPSHFITGFLALLELARTHKVKILQGQHFGDIVVRLA